MFDASKHPKIVSGEMTQDQAFDNFSKNFNDIGGKINKAEWDDYYSAVSYSMENDDHFLYLIKSVWQLN